MSRNIIYFFLFCHIKKEIAAVTPCCLISVNGEITLMAKIKPNKKPSCKLCWITSIGDNRALKYKVPIFGLIKACLSDIAAIYMTVLRPFYCLAANAWLMGNTDCLWLVRNHMYFDPQICRASFFSIMPCPRSLRPLLCVHFCVSNSLQRMLQFLEMHHLGGRNCKWGLMPVWWEIVDVCERVRECAIQMHRRAFSFRKLTNQLKLMLVHLPSKYFCSPLLFGNLHIKLFKFSLTSFIFTSGWLLPRPHFQHSVIMCLNCSVFHSHPPPPLCVYN